MSAVIFAWKSSSEMTFGNVGSIPAPLDGLLRERGCERGCVRESECASWLLRWRLSSPCS